MWTNPKYFYSYVKKMTKKKGKIGPFTDSKGKVINDEPAEILQNQYSSVWTPPLEELKVDMQDDLLSKRG